MSLYTDLVLSKHRKIHPDGFWGEYKILNSLEKTYDIAQLKKLQYQTLKQSQTNYRIQQANQFLNNLPSYKISETEEVVANQLLSEIMSILNSPFKSGDASIRNTGAERIERLNVLFKTLNMSTDIIPAQVNQVLSETQIISKEYRDIFYSYIREKAQLCENIVREYLNNLNGGGRAVVTGNVGNIDDSNRQLITDIYYWCQRDLNKTITGKKAVYTKGLTREESLSAAKSALWCDVNSTELINFINEIDRVNGSATLSISINDELQDFLNTTSTLKIQAKSGVNQKIINSNSRTVLSFDELLGGPNILLQSLTKLYEEDAKNGFIYLYKNPKGSSNLTNYANFLLSMNIQKTAIAKPNNIYFTEKGFETAAQWLERQSMYLSFKRKIKLNNSLMTERRQVYLTK